MAAGWLKYGGNGGRRAMLTRKLLTVKDVSGYTGLAPDTIYTMVNQRRIPYVKVGRLVKFDMELLDQWIKQQTVMPMPSKISS